MQTVYAYGGGGGDSQQREVTDGADVVFTDTARRRTIQPTVGHLVRGLDDRLSVGLLADRQE